MKMKNLILNPAAPFWIVLLAMSPVVHADGQTNPPVPPPTPTVPTQLDRIETAIGTLQTDLTDARGDLKTSLNGLAGLQTSLDSLANTQSKDAADLKKRIAALKQVADKIMAGVEGVASNLAVVQNEVISTRTELKADIAAVNDNVTRANYTLDSLVAAFGKTEAQRISDDIERQLREGSYQLSLYSTADQGGRLDLVRDIVTRRLQEASDHGFDSKISQRVFKWAEDAYSNGKYSSALSYYGRTYRKIVQATKGPFSIFPLF